MWFFVVAASLDIPTMVDKGSSFLTFSPTRVLFSFYKILRVGILMGMKWYRTVAWICISPMMSDVEHLFKNTSF